VGILRFRDGAHPGAGEDGIVEGEEDLLDASGFGFVEPPSQLLHLFFVCRLGGGPRRGLTIVIGTGPQEHEAGALVVELVCELVGRHAELFQVGNRAQNAVDLGIPPHLVIADCGKPATLQTGRAHRGIWRGQLAQNSLVDLLPVRAIEDRLTLESPPHDVAGVDHESARPL